MRKERNHKNVLTLKGQVCTFFIGMSHSFYILLHVSSFSFDPSTMAISLIVNSTLISVTQLVSSHELQRFLQRCFQWIVTILHGTQICFLIILFFTLFCLIFLKWLFDWWRQMLVPIFYVRIFHLLGCQSLFV